ncbi:MAG: hypothetical protein DI586_00020 [Micavibrio aeruginosavorus]|uniref:Uncharacterized protein n=1 Tax=Micavibrio aeruginosavorus TaxID=349221 RepID=A0A2W5FNB8_9BACT|nr:MAG: hypothetical protein DI586_00020 [Micavibrio aeruginosavorus]
MANFNANFTGLGSSGPNQADNLNGAAMESRYAPQAIMAQMQVEAGKLHAEMNDGGAANNSGGAVGFLGRAVTGVAATAAATALAGPAAGAVVGAGFALKDGISSMASAIQPQQEEGGYYTLARSLKEMQGGAAAKDTAIESYDNPQDDPICRNYVDSQGAYFADGFAQKKMPVSNIAVMNEKKVDSAQEQKIREKIGTLAGKLDDHDNQTSTVRGIAPKIGVHVAEGPAAPKMPGMVIPGFG